MSNENQRVVSKSGYCYICGGKGFVDKVCPSCGHEMRKKVIDFSQVDTEEFVKDVKKLNIPSQYDGVTWDGEVLRHYKTEDQNNTSFDKYISQLDKIHSVFVSGSLPQKSAIIISPVGYSKRVFAYSCMQRALLQGWTVAPVLDTMDLKRLFVLSADKPGYKLFGNVDYDEYITSDVCFVEVTRLPQHMYAAPIIQEILDRRGRLGKSTFILSTYSLEEMSKYDSSGSFSAIKNQGIVDNYKYPAVIPFFKFND